MWDRKTEQEAIHIAHDSKNCIKKIAKNSSTVVDASACANADAADVRTFDVAAVTDWGTLANSRRAGASRPVPNGTAPNANNDSG